MGGRLLQCAGKRLSLDRPRVMGVLNITPDSFSDGGAVYRQGRVDAGAVLARAQSMLEAGASIIDIGGESTRPGAAPVPTGEELSRVMPVVETLLGLDTIVSVDTSKVEVARVALAAGCHLVNDVCGLADQRMIELLAGSDAAVCIMHMRGKPRTMQDAPSYDDVVVEVRQLLTERLEQARRGGVCGPRICVDPGFGFGKTLDHNLILLKQLEQIRVDDAPILVGLSRKRMIGSVTGRDIGERKAGSVAAAMLAVQRGANIVRVHDVAETVDALKILEAAG